MLFNSYIFIFCFLPITLAVFYFLGRFENKSYALASLVLASFIFYAWWNVQYLLLLWASILVNYSFGSWLHLKKSKLVMALGVAFNLLLLMYFKYAMFILEAFQYAMGVPSFIPHIILPLAISFFTFQQIAYLVDMYQGKTEKLAFGSYFLFVCFFPQLIAGPIVHHKEMVVQFSQKTFGQASLQNITIGLSIFAVGLFKKVVLADGVSPYANMAFYTAHTGEALSLLDAWCGVFAYSFQLYFDFSGYSDMAIGLARLFGVKLPLNFSSPYKAKNIIEFWRAWHITLSRFLRDYLYIPLGGNRFGIISRYKNLMMTMLLGGLWHGAGWNFLIWGGLHGFYLIVNHGWHYGKTKYNIELCLPTFIATFVSTGVTFIFVCLAWVFFRAETLTASGVMFEALFQGHIINFLVLDKALLIWLCGLSFIAFFLPNTQQFFSSYSPSLDKVTYIDKFKITWSPNMVWGGVVGLMFVISVLMMSGESEFLYFQF